MHGLCLMVQLKFDIDLKREVHIKRQSKERK